MYSASSTYRPVLSPQKYPLICNVRINVKESTCIFTRSLKMFIYLIIKQNHEKDAFSCLLSHFLIILYLFIHDCLNYYTHSNGFGFELEGKTRAWFFDIWELYMYCGTICILYLLWIDSRRKGTPICHVFKKFFLIYVDCENDKFTGLYAFNFVF